MASDDVSRIELLLREHFARTEKQISELQSEIIVMKNDIERMKRDVGFMHDWDLWLIMVLVTVLALPKIAEGMKAFVMTVIETISEIAGVFRKDSKS